MKKIGVNLFLVVVTAAVTHYFTLRGQARELANELGRAEGRLEETQAQRDAAEAHAGKLQVEVADLKEKSELLERYGGDFTLYKRWEPFKDPKQPLVLGRCEGTACAAVQFEEIAGQGPTSVIKFSLLDRGGLLKPLVATLPLRRGCTREIGIREELLDVTIEDDSYQKPALGFVVRPRPPTKRPVNQPPDWSPSFDLVIDGRYSCDRQEYHCRNAGSGEVDRIACLDGSMGRMDEVAARAADAVAWVEEASGEWAFYVRRAPGPWQRFVPK